MGVGHGYDLSDPMRLGHGSGQSDLMGVGHFWHLLKVKWLVIALFITLTCIDQCQSTSILERSKRDTSQDECVRKCVEDCKSYPDSPQPEVGEGGRASAGRRAGEGRGAKSAGGKASRRTRKGDNTEERVAKDEEGDHKRKTRKKRERVEVRNEEPCNHPPRIKGFPIHMRMIA
ncbi:hypothetical protein ElyMa_005474500 [Elysia marginata]|uniref:Uncharacterized protein n=1 Tax=Elysia marginata TaxID=1093978 RepID=A0AAV4ERS2_9GAST|nr:hypothetical protein ElyMa_005474500 [Elysia marginata]